MLHRYAEVVVNAPLKKAYHYEIPEYLHGKLCPGKRVHVPFGNRRMIGYCVGLVETPQVEDVKKILSVLDEEPMVDQGMLRLTQWLSEYYNCGWGETLDAVLPAGVKRNITSKTISLVELAIDKEKIEETIDALSSRAKKQAAVLHFLSTVDGPISALDAVKVVGCTMSTLYACRDRGLIEFRQETVEAGELLDVGVEASEAPVLTPEQRAALDSISKRTSKKEFGVMLLHGVTGSGKTEVYLQAIAEVVARGQQAIVLVPEISLTPQTIRRFKSRLHEVAVLHSHLPAGQRHEQWRLIRSGEAKVVIGARSAIFAPVRDLGLIVVDEEHEPSFKQQSTPRYHARDIAVMRAQIENAVVVLGSATPSLETFYNATGGKYDLGSLPKRVMSRPMPKVEIVNMREEFAERKRMVIFSRRLENLMRESLDRGEQIMLFLNRRGFSSAVRCQRCGFVLKCKRCDVSLTHHKKRNVALCHYCNETVEPPETCPECHFDSMRYFGLGTEKVETEIRRIFPDKRVARMDTDTTRTRGAHRQILDTFRDGKIDILVGTQMIAKGLDFPNVTVVGVVSADTALSICDFRASERTFQLLAQVAGRTGRGDKGGRVVIQSFSPDHFSIQTAAEHDYHSFAEQELVLRNEFGYPPFGRLARIVVQGKDEDAVRKKVERIGGQLVAASENGSGFEILGPAPAPISMIKGRTRWHVIIKGKTTASIKKALAAADDQIRSTKALQVISDVDPTDML